MIHNSVRSASAHLEEDQTPKYIRGHTIAVVSVAFAWTLVAINMYVFLSLFMHCHLLLIRLYCMWENKARSEGRRDSNLAKYRVLRGAALTKAPIGDRHPNFLFTL